MKVFGCRQATQNLAAVLDAVRQDGAAVIGNRAGQSFVIRPGGARKSALDVEGVDLHVATDEIVATVREGRERDG